MEFTRVDPGGIGEGEDYLSIGGDEHTIDAVGEDQSGDAAWDEVSRSPWVGERDAQGLADTCDLQVSVARGNVCRL